MNPFKSNGMTVSFSPVYNSNVQCIIIKYTSVVLITLKLELIRINKNYYSHIEIYDQAHQLVNQNDYNNTNYKKKYNIQHPLSAGYRSILIFTF